MIVNFFFKEITVKPAFLVMIARNSAKILLHAEEGDSFDTRNDLSGQDQSSLPGAHQMEPPSPLESTLSRVDL